MDVMYMFEILPSFLSVLHITVIALVASATLGLLLGVLITTIRIKEIKFLKKLVELFISFTRSVPIVLQLFLVYYALPVVLSLVGIEIRGLSPMVATVIALTLYNAGYMSEVIRPAYLSVSRGQHEAAKSLGYTPFQRIRRIIVPQVVPVALPGWGNALVYLLQDTALIFTIGVIDIMGTADILVSGSYGVNQVEIYLTVAIMFWIICLIIDQIIRLLEKKTEKFHLGSGIKR